VETYKVGRNAVAGDTISSQNFYAKNSAGVKTEFARMEASVRNTGVGNDDGSIALSGLVNGTMTEFFRVNGADSENNCFLPLDMNNQSIKSSSGNLNFSTTGSSGGGVITMTSKTQTPSSTAEMVFTNNVTNTLTHSVSAGWDFQANNLTTTGNITCNTLNYTALNPPISGGVSFSSLVVANSSLVLTGTAYGKLYYHGGSSNDWIMTLPDAGTQTGGSITFTITNAPNSYGFNFSGVGVIGGLYLYNKLVTDVNTLYSYTFYDAGATIGWLLV
jgi:hypothetical protein